MPSAGPGWPVWAWPVPARSAPARTGPSPPPARDLITPTTVDPPLVDGMITSDVERVAPIYLGSPHPDDYVSAVPQPPADGGTASSFQRSEERRVGKEGRSVWWR